MVNNAEGKLGQGEGSGELKHKKFLTANFVQDSRQAGSWPGELSIPSRWMEGGTRTYERTGAASPIARRTSTP